MEVDLGRSHIVLDGNPAPQRDTAAQFSAHICCGQTARWIKMPLGREVGRGPGDIVLDGDPAPPQRKRRHSSHPIFSPCLLWPNGWMDQDATWYEGRPQPRRHRVRCGASSLPPKRGHSPQFSPDVCCGQDPGAQAVSQQVTVSYPLGSRLPLLSARPAVTFPATEHHRPLAGTKLYCLVTEAHRCEQLAQGCWLLCSDASSRIEPATTDRKFNDLLIALPRHLFFVHSLI